MRTVSIELAGAVSLCPGEVWVEAAVAAPRVHAVQPGVPALAVAPVLAQVPALVVVTVPTPDSIFYWDKWAILFLTCQSDLMLNFP